MFGKIGLPELILILVIALIIFGPRKLPDIGRSIGRGLREFKQATTEISRNVSLDDDDEIDVGGSKKTIEKKLETTESKDQNEEVEKTEQTILDSGVVTDEEGATVSEPGENEQEIINTEEKEDNNTENKEEKTKH